MILPETNRFEEESVQEQPAVTIYSDLATRQSWFGKVVRTEGAFDEASQQLFVVAQIDDPYGKNDSDSMPLKIGQYVSAKIDGKVIKEALTIPNRAIYQGTYVYVVEDNVLKRKNISIAWQNDDVAMIKAGLEANQLLVLTPLGQVTSGTIVNVSSIDGQESKNQDKPKKPMNEGKKTDGKNNAADKRKDRAEKAKGAES